MGCKCSDSKDRPDKPSKNTDPGKPILKAIAPGETDLLLEKCSYQSDQENGIVSTEHYSMAKEGIDMLDPIENNIWDAQKDIDNKNGEVIHLFYANFTDPSSGSEAEKKSSKNLGIIVQTQKDAPDEEEVSVETKDVLGATPSNILGNTPMSDEMANKWKDSSIEIPEAHKKAAARDKNDEVVHLYYAKFTDPSPEGERKEKPVTGVVIQTQKEIPAVRGSENDEDVVHKFIDCSPEGERKEKPQTGVVIQTEKKSPCAPRNENEENLVNLFYANFSDSSSEGKRKENTKLGDIQSVNETPVDQTDSAKITGVDVVPTPKAKVSDDDIFKYVDAVRETVEDYEVNRSNEDATKLEEPLEDVSSSKLTADIDALKRFVEKFRGDVFSAIKLHTQALAKITAENRSFEKVETGATAIKSKEESATETNRSVEIVSLANTEQEIEKPQKHHEQSSSNLTKPEVNNVNGNSNIDNKANEPALRIPKKMSSGLE